MAILDDELLRLFFDEETMTPSTIGALGREVQRLRADLAAAREENAKLRAAWPEWNLETEDLEAAPRTIIPHDGFWYVNKDMVFAEVFVSCHHRYSMYDTRDEAINAAAGITNDTDT